MDNELFLNGLIYFAAAAIAAPLGRRFGLGAVRGYLIIGAIIAPAAFGWVGENPEEVMHFAEFGVVLMLFVIGLEIDLSRLWTMRGPILGLGGLQVGITATSAGTQSFAVLLFQDIAVIPMIALLPLLAGLPAAAGPDAHTGTYWIESVPGWSKGFIVVGAIALVVVIGRFLLTPWLRWIASLKVTEALTATPPGRAC